MRNNIVYVPSIIKPIPASPGFAKKLLSQYKLDIAGLCGFGCTYCSSNSGNYLRINRKRFARLTGKQLGRSTLPADDPTLMFVWRDIIKRLEAQLASKKPDWGSGKTLVFSMLTDGFSPWLVGNDVTEAALKLVLERTAFRIRVLTKNAVVGSPRWIKFFTSHPGRFVVGLSIGTLDDEWARRVEIGTPKPSSRLQALANLQAAGIPTYGMICPAFPDALESGQLETLIERINPDVVEHMWAEPFNDRGGNWKNVRAGYDVGSPGYNRLTAIFDGSDPGAWSRYATALYQRLCAHARKNGWMRKLRYLLYEGRITAQDAKKFRGLKGVLLQSPQDDEGFSKNGFIAADQLARNIKLRPPR